MDDLSEEMLKSLEEYSRSLGFKNTLVIDCHNAMGPPLSKANGESLLIAGRQCLKE